MSGEERIKYSSLKIALITIQLLCTALFSGILFGWAPFQLIMISEGLYACKESTATGAGGLGEEENSNDEKEGECVSQQSNLNLLFTIATSTFLISSLFVGIFVDHYGPTRTVILVSSNSLFETASLLTLYFPSHPLPFPLSRLPPSALPPRTLPVFSSSYHSPLYLPFLSPSPPSLPFL